MTRNRAGEEICDRTDLPEGMCSHCRALPWEPPVDLAAATAEPDEPVVEAPLRGRVVLDQPGPAVRTHSIRAERESDCPGCGNRIIPGDRIVVTSERQWLCEDCADEQGRQL